MAECHNEIFQMTVQQFDRRKPWVTETDCSLADVTKFIQSPPAVSDPNRVMWTHRGSDATERCDCVFKIQEYYPQKIGMF